MHKKLSEIENQREFTENKNVNMTEFKYLREIGFEYKKV